MTRNYDITKTPQDLRYLKWDEVSCPTGMQGARETAREGTGANAAFYKKSSARCAESGPCDVFAELVCSRLMKVLEIEHVEIRLVFAVTDDFGGPRWLSRSKSILARGERSVPLERFFAYRSLPGESPLELCLRMGWGRQVSDMALADYLTATRQRNASHLDVICGSDGNFRLAPLAPQPFSLLNAFPMEAWQRFVTFDINTDNYLGSSSLDENLELVDASRRLPALTRSVKNEVVGGLTGLGMDSFVEASWQIIEERWKHFARLRHL